MRRFHFRPKLNTAQQTASAIPAPQQIEELSLAVPPSLPTVLPSDTQITPGPMQNNEPMTLSHPTSNTPGLRLVPLGGVGDVTKNLYVYEYGNDIIMVDCGVGFPDEGMLGIDLVIPDFSYLRDKKERIRALIVSHGHEDHIGAVPYFLREFDVPVYGTKLPIGLIKLKLKEHHLEGKKLVVIDPKETLQFGPFTVDFYRVSHSIPDSLGIRIKTPVGSIIHQADFKFDWTPVNQDPFDIGKLATLTREPILVMLMDCLRVEKPGYTLSEKMIEETFITAMSDAPAKVIITTTSSNVSRLQQAVNAAVRFNRKVSFSGRSMEQVIELAQDLGYLRIPPGVLVSQDQAKHIPDNELLVVAAGSQGQVGSSLSRIANGTHEAIRLKNGDVVIFSADPIPSTESAVGALIDTLTKKGAQVYYSDVLADLHVSGHASKEEIKMLIGIVKPKYLIPIGGTFRHMRQFAKVAQTMHYKANQVLLLEDGQTVDFTQNSAKLGSKVEVRNIMIDGLGVGDVGNVVLRDRQQMAADGIVVVIVPIDQHTGQIAGEPDIVSRGFVYMKDSGELIDKAQAVVKQCLAGRKGLVSDWHFIRRRIEEALEKYLYKATKRNPMILPVVIEV